MKPALLFVLCTGVLLPSANGSGTSQMRQQEIVHISTALDHLTVLEFGEPVTMAAAGSTAFQIERHEDKVFIKPVKTGTATDLFIWTVSRRFTYELDAPGEIRNMDFLLDNRVSLPRPPASANQSLEEIADMMLTRAFLGAERVDNRAIKTLRGRVIVRIEHVFSSKDSVYIHYSIRNLGEHTYRLPTPTAHQLFPSQPGVSLLALRYTQLSGSLSTRLGKAKSVEIPIANAAAQKEDVPVGEDAQGVIAIRLHSDEPCVLRLMFAGDDSQRVQATLVL